MTARAHASSGRLSIIGRGPVGQAIADIAAGVGWEVTMSGRTGAPADTGPVVVATPGTEVVDLLTEHGPALAERVVIDTTNHLAGPPWIEGMAVPPLHQRSAWQRLAPGAIWMRAFCTSGVESFRSRPGSPPLHVYCGPESGRDVAERLIGAAGHDSVWLGDSETAYADVDAAAQLWFALALRRGSGRDLTLVRAG